MTSQPHWADILTGPTRQDHVVQMYRDERRLFDAVGLYTQAALGRGEAVILVVTPPHAEAIDERLRREAFAVDDLKSRGQLVVLDAADLLSRFMVDGLPDAERFKSVIGEVIHSAKAARGHDKVRAFGEMVNLLWRQNLPATTRLEQLWNDVIAEHAISLFCAYCLDDDAEASFPRELREVHSHLIPVRAHDEPSVGPRGAGPISA